MANNLRESTKWNPYSYEILLQFGQMRILQKGEYSFDLDCILSGNEGGREGGKERKKEGMNK